MYLQFEFTTIFFVIIITLSSSFFDYIHCFQIANFNLIILFHFYFMLIIILVEIVVENYLLWKLPFVLYVIYFGCASFLNRRLQSLYILIFWINLLRIRTYLILMNLSTLTNRLNSLFILLIQLSQFSGTLRNSLDLLCSVNLLNYLFIFCTLVLTLLLRRSPPPIPYIHSN